MSESHPENLPKIARYKPYYDELEADKTYLWCACGLSKNQPYCDGSHQGTGFLPVKYKASEDEEVLLCGCKHTADAPFCDGTHNNLKDEYDTDDPDSLENKAIAVSLTICVGETAFTLKCTYDEAYRSFSPGLLLEQDIIIISILRAQWVSFLMMLSKPETF